LAKVIEKTKGERTRDDFVNALDGQGFGYVEGFRVAILTFGEKQHGQQQQYIRISFEKKEPETGRVVFQYDEIVPAEIIDTMIQEGGSSPNNLTKTDG